MIRVCAILERLMSGIRLKALGLFAALALMFGAGLLIGGGHGGDTVLAQSAATVVIDSETQPQGIDLSEFWRAWKILDQNFVQVHASTTIPTTQKRLEGAIAGLTASFGDPYTTFFPPSDAKIFNEDVSGSFSGVGMQIDLNSKGQLVVVAPLKDSPAQHAGVLSGDLILEIGTTTTDNISVEDAVKLIRGPKGSSVSLMIARQGETRPLTISVVRDTINIPVINSYKRDDGIFVIELYSFSANSADLFQNALRQFVQSGSTKLLLDLRGNPGGYLDASVEMASYFLPVGDTVVTEDFKGHQNNISHRSFGYNVFAGNKNFKMAILTDQGSASASEILAGALQQHGVAKLVGTRTFGKGSVQELVDLGGGAELKITVARWLTPNGTSISDGGLTPDIKADRTRDDVTAGRDPQIATAVIYLLNN